MGGRETCAAVERRPNLARGVRPGTPASSHDAVAAGATEGAGHRSIENQFIGISSAGGWRLGRNDPPATVTSSRSDAPPGLTVGCGCPQPWGWRPRLSTVAAPRLGTELRRQSLIVGGVAGHGSTHQHSSTRTPNPFSTTRVSILPAPNHRARIGTCRSGNAAAKGFPDFVRRQPGTGRFLEPHPGFGRFVAGFPGYNPSD
jgi:hypothetical protein